MKSTALSEHVHNEMARARRAAYDETRPHAERRTAANKLERLAATVRVALDEEVRTAVRATLPRERAEG